MFKWLLQWFSGRERLREVAPHLAAVAQHQALHWPALEGVAQQSQVYAQSPWVYIAVNRIAEAAALAPLQVLRREGEQQIAVERHPLEVLLDAPNPYLSRFELFEQTLGMLELTGNAYWFLAGSGAPSEIWPLRPDRVSIVPDPAQYVRGYVYEIDGQRIPLEPVEVVHFRRWHPHNDYYGLSALEAGRIAISSDQAMAQWNRNSFGQERGVPAGIVNIHDSVSDADFERMKREWRQSYGGTQRKTAFLRGGGVSWQNIGLSHTDLDFLKGREAQRNEILNLFGIPVGLVSENSTEANAKVAERLFIERTLWPKLVRIAQKITQDLLPFWPGDHVALFEDIRPTDVQARLDEIKTAYPLLSINELRSQYYQLPPVDWGELSVSMSQAVGTQRAVSDNDGRAQHAVPLRNEGGAVSAKDALLELRQWERFTLKRWGQGEGRAFEVRSLPDEVAYEISAGLLAAQSPDEAQTVFQAARDGLTPESA